MTWLIQLDRAATDEDEVKAGMASTELATELDEELRVCTEALQDQAQEMLSLLYQFEARLKNRLELAEARIAAMRSATAARRN